MLTPEQRQRLDALGFVWDIRRDRWESQFRALKEYKSEHGDVAVPRDCLEHEGQGSSTGSGSESDSEDDAEPGQEVRRLWQWLANQRSLYHAGKLAEDRRQALEALGVEWEDHWL